MPLQRHASAKPQKGDHQRAKAALDRLKAKADKLVYEWVTARDPLCRACHSRPTAHRHHLRGKDFTTREDVCGVCDECHTAMHVRVGGKTLKLYGNAEQRSALSGQPLGLTVERLIKGEWVKWCDR